MFSKYQVKSDVLSKHITHIHFGVLFIDKSSPYSICAMFFYKIIVIFGPWISKQQKRTVPCLLGHASLQLDMFEKLHMHEEKITS